MKILFVDDSSFIHKIYSLLIKEKFPDATIISACNGEEGLSLFHKENPDIIISDLLMPIMSGIEMISTIRKENSQIKIIVVTADIQKSIQKELQQMQIHALINKPLTEETRLLLVDAIRRC